MEKIKLTNIQHYSKDKQGNPLIGKNGPYEKCVLTAGGKKYYGFGNSTTKYFQVGQEVEVEVTERNGFLNFKLPPKTVSRAEFDELKLRVEALEQFNASNLRGEPVEPEIPLDEPFEDMP